MTVSPKITKTDIILFKLLPQSAQRSQRIVGLVPRTSLMFRADEGISPYILFASLCESQYLWFIVVHSHFCIPQKPLWEQTYPHQW